MPISDKKTLYIQKKPFIVPVKFAENCCPITNKNTKNRSSDMIIRGSDFKTRSNFTAKHQNIAVMLQSIEHFLPS